MMDNEISFAIETLNKIAFETRLQLYGKSKESIIKSLAEKHEINLKEGAYMYCKKASEFSSDEYLTPDDFWAYVYDNK